MKSRGFTLLEMVISLSILSLLAGAIFSIIWRTGEEAAEIRELDSRDEQVSRLIRLMRDSIESLPTGAEMEMTPAVESPTGYDELKITGAMSAFVFGDNPGTTGETILALRPQPESDTGPVFETDEPLFEVALSREDFAPQDTDGSGMAFRVGDDNTFLQADEEGRYWLPLLGNLTAMTWRYWDEDNRDWLTEWEGENLPPLMELSLTDPYRSLPLRVIFDVPDHLANPPPEPEPIAEEGTIGNPVGGGNTTAVQQPRDQGQRPQGQRPEGGQGRPGGDGRGRGDGGGRPGGGGRPEGGGRPTDGNGGGGGDAR